MSPLPIIPILGTVFIIARTFLESRPTISPKEAFAAVETGTAVLVDAREPVEWGAGVARAAVRLPLSDLRSQRELRIPFLNNNRRKRILPYCHSGMRSGTAASVLKAEGFDPANVGTLKSQQECGMPVRAPQ
ncbi:MAG: rhodanese-like domain-containing protein [Opitutaceae bacterium]|jgi:rhodanese-related sulfurtransferase